MIKERSLSFGKIYHRESNVPELYPFHLKKKPTDLQIVFYETTNTCPGYTQVPKPLKFVLRKFFTPQKTTT